MLPRTSATALALLPLLGRGQVAPQVPRWPVSYNLRSSTFVMACNGSGGPLDPAFTSQWGIVDLDWSNWRVDRPHRPPGTLNGWSMTQPMDAEERLVLQAEISRNASTKPLIWVYRNTVQAMPWFKAVRDKLTNPAFSGFFLKFACNRTGATNGTYAGGCHVPPQGSLLYHDQEQTSHGTCGTGSGPSKCCGVPCGMYAFDHRNGSMLREWFVNEFIGGENGLGNPAVAGFYLDDNWSNDSPTEMDPLLTQDCGLSKEEAAKVQQGWQENAAAMGRAIIEKGGLSYPHFELAGPASGPLNADEPLNDTARETACQSYFERYCAISATTNEPDIFSKPLLYVFTRLTKSQAVAAGGGLNTIWYPNGSLPAFDTDLATFMLIRGPHAWIGYTWSGCTNSAWPPGCNRSCTGATPDQRLPACNVCRFPEARDAAPFPKPAALEESHGIPLGPCSQTSEGSHVWRREWTGATVEMNCKTYQAKITKKRPLKGDDMPALQIHRPDASTWRRTQCGHPNGTADIPTRWGKQVSAATTPLPAYPRPRMVRTSTPPTCSLDTLRDTGDNATWTNLNGLWEWEPVRCDVPRKNCPAMNPPLLCCPSGNFSTVPPFGRTLSRSILVPFPQESCLSGVAPRSSDAVAMRSWYRLTFTLPAAASGRRQLLHFGAVDWHATVFVNKKMVANHTGGYDGFTADVTDALAAHGGENELLVWVYDPSETGPQPSGKQRLGVLSNPGELWTIVYTSSTGIWQTVWLETVGVDYISDVAVDQASLDTVTINVSAVLSIAANSLSTTAVTVTALDGGVTVGSATGPPNSQLKIKLPTPKLWDPNDAKPHLYDLSVKLSSGDEVLSYFGLRTWSLTPGFGEVADGPVLSGVDIGGRDLRGCSQFNNCSVADRAGCREMCQGTPGCLGWVFSNCSSSNNCWLKSDVGLNCTTTMRRAHGVGFSLSCSTEGQGCRESQVLGYRSAPRPLFNGRHTFFTGALDQSWWPDGQFTAPTDFALQEDLLEVKRMGFNMLRLHQKVNPERWYYFADKLGVAIFQDMPQKYLAQGRTNETVKFFVDDLKAMVAGRGSHPSILQYTAFNEVLNFG